MAAIYTFVDPEEPDDVLPLTATLSTQKPQVWQQEWLLQPAKSICALLYPIK